jgi:DedD protein
MKGVFEDSEVEAPAPRRVTELTLGSFALLVIFFGLVLVCGFCFGLGYSMGHRGPQGTASASILPAGSPSTVHADTTHADAGNADPGSADNATPKPAPIAESVPAEQPSSPAPAVQTSPAPIVQTTPPPSVQSPPQPVAPGATAAKQADKPAPAQPIAAPAKKEAKTASAEAAPPAAAGPIMVQIAAVAQQEDAEVLMGALRKRGYEVISTREPLDGLMHVRIGPFTTKDEAETWRQKLLNDGYNAIVQP